MDNEWLNLSETADILGVHPATVRLWADRGELPSQRTPGGHRRFRRADVASRAHHHDRAQLTAAQLVMQNILGRARLELADGEANLESWHQGLDETARQAHREIGRRLLHLVIESMAGTADVHTTLTQAQQIGQDYERLGRQNNLSLVETTRAYLFFREFMSQAVYDMMTAAGPQTTTDWGQIRHQFVQITNEILLAIITAHEQHNP